MKIQEYLLRNQLTGIPIGFSTDDPEELTTYHQYLYHMLPKKEILEKYKKAAEKPGDKDKKKKEKKEISYIMKRVKTFGQGDSFGELALEKDSKKGVRAGRVVSITDSHFMIFEKKYFQATFEKIEKRLVEEKVAFLRNLHFFKGWSKINTKK